MPNVSLAYNQSYTNIRKLSEQEIFDVITALSSNPDNIRMSYHANDRLNDDKRNMSYDKLIKILRFPQRLVKVTYNHNHQEYVYTIRGANSRHAAITIRTDKYGRNPHIWIVTTY